MRIGILACSVFEPELEKVLQDIKIKQLFKDNIDVTYLHFGLHTNLDKLEKDVTASLDKLTLEYDQVIILYGSKCHYRFFEFLKKYNNIIKPIVKVGYKNCYSRNKIYCNSFLFYRFTNFMRKDAKQ